jgi:cyanophycinase
MMRFPGSLVLIVSIIYSLLSPLGGLAFGQTSNINIIAIGGGNDEQFLQALSNISIRNHKEILIIAAANPSCERLKECSEAYKEYFLKLGTPIVNTLVICSKEDANCVQPEKLNNCNLFLPGGDQRVFMQRVGSTSLHKYIINSIKDGNLYMGTSATTSCIGSLMISGSLEDGDFVVEKGLGIVPDIIFDQHFSERKRQGRLEKVIKDNPSYKGIGIDQGTALFISGNEYKVMGEGRAHYINYCKEDIVNGN